MFLGQVAGALLAFVLVLLITRSIGVESAGIYFLFMAIYSVTGVLSRLGFEGTLLKHMSVARSQGEYGKSKTIFFIGLKSVCLASIAFSALINLASSRNLPYSRRR